MAPSSPYERATYTLRRFEVIAPHVRNDGAPSGYPAEVRIFLAANGFTGWTEVETVGTWIGTRGMQREPGTTFVIFADDKREGAVRPTADILAELARAAMPDQDAIQLVIGEVVELHEA